MYFSYTWQTWESQGRAVFEDHCSCIRLRNEIGLFLFRLQGDVGCMLRVFDQSRARGRIGTRRCNLRCVVTRVILVTGNVTGSRTFPSRLWHTSGKRRLHRQGSLGFLCIVLTNNDFSSGTDWGRGKYSLFSARKILLVPIWRQIRGFFVEQIRGSCYGLDPTTF